MAELEESEELAEAVKVVQLEPAISASQGSTGPAPASVSTSDLALSQPRRGRGRPPKPRAASTYTQHNPMPAPVYLDLASPALAASFLSVTPTSSLPAQQMTLTDAIGQNHTVQVAIQSDKFDEDGGFYTVFKKSVPMLRRARLSGDCRLVLDWLCEHIEFKTGNIVLRVTNSTVAAEALAPVKISQQRACLLLRQIEDAGFIYREPELVLRGTVYINPHYFVLGDAKLHRKCVAAWDKSVEVVRARERAREQEQTQTQARIAILVDRESESIEQTETVAEN